MIRIAVTRNIGHIIKRAALLRTISKNLLVSTYSGFGLYLRTCNTGKCIICILFAPNIVRKDLAALNAGKKKYPAPNAARIAAAGGENVIQTVRGVGYVIRDEHE